MFSFQRGSIAGPPLQLCDKDCPQVSPVPSRVLWEMKCLDHLFITYMPQCTHRVCFLLVVMLGRGCLHRASHKSVLMQLFKPIPHVINTNYIPKHIYKMVAHLETLGIYIKNGSSPVLNHSSWPKSSDANIHRVFSAQLQCPLSVWSLWNLYHQCYSLPYTWKS